MVFMTRQVPSFIMPLHPLHCGTSSGLTQNFPHVRHFSSVSCPFSWCTLKSLSNLCSFAGKVFAWILMSRVYVTAALPVVAKISKALVKRVMNELKKKAETAKKASERAAAARAARDHVPAGAQVLQTPTLLVQELRGRRPPGLPVWIDALVQELELRRQGKARATRRSFSRCCGARRACPRGGVGWTPAEEVRRRKGGEEAECFTACGEAPKDDDDGTGPLDQGCYDQCIDKGASEAECVAACSEGDGGKESDGGKDGDMGD